MFATNHILLAHNLHRPGCCNCSRNVRPGGTPPETRATAVLHVATVCILSAPHGITATQFVDNSPALRAQPAIRGPVASTPD